MRRRSSTLELASFFFEPFQLHLQAPDLLVELLLALLGRLRVVVRLAGKHLGKLLSYLLLPLAHLYRMDLVLGGYGVNRLDALQGFQADTGFQIGTMLTAFL